MAPGADMGSKVGAVPREGWAGAIRPGSTSCPACDASDPSSLIKFHFIAALLMGVSCKG